MYLPIADSAYVLDNSTPESGLGKVIAKKEYKKDLIVVDEEIWKQIEKDANAKIK